MVNVKIGQKIMNEDNVLKEVHNFIQRSCWQNKFERNLQLQPFFIIKNEIAVKMLLF